MIREFIAIPAPSFLSSDLFSALSRHAGCGDPGPAAAAKHSVTDCLVRPSFRVSRGYAGASNSNLDRISQVKFFSTVNQEDFNINFCSGSASKNVPSEHDGLFVPSRCVFKICMVVRAAGEAWQILLSSGPRRRPLVHTGKIKNLMKQITKFMTRRPRGHNSRAVLSGGAGVGGNMAIPGQHLLDWVSVGGK